MDSNSFITGFRMRDRRMERLMPYSLFDLLVGRLFASPDRRNEDLSFLTAAEIHELLRMREEVRLAREQVRFTITRARMGVL